MEQQEISFTAGGNANGTATLRDSLVASYKTKHTHTIQQLCSFGIYLKELKTHVYTTTCRWMLIVALFFIAEIWMQSRCLSEGEWINCGTYKQ